MNKRWLSNSKTAKLSESDKTRLRAVVSQFIAVSSRLRKIVHRTEIKAGRIYFYCLHEQFGWDNPDAIFIKPLINGKYIEVLMARITLYDKSWETCTADWQRHNEKWISVHEGNINECLQFIEKNEQWFC